MTPDAELQIFAIKRGQLEQRIDVSFYLPSMTEVLTKIKNSKYEVVHLNKLLDDLTDGTHYTPSYTEKGVKFISVTNITENKIDFENTKYISEKEHSEFIRRCNPESNSILLTKIGSIGRAAVIPESCPPFSIFVSVALLKVNKKIIPDFLCAYLNSSLALRQFERYLKGIGVPDLHLENIAQTQIIVPGRDEQKKFARDYMNAFANYQNKLLAAEELLAGMDEFITNHIGLAKSDFSKHRMCWGMKRMDLNPRRLDALFNMSSSCDKFNSHHEYRLADIAILNSNSKKNIMFSENVPYVGLPECSSNGIISIEKKKYKEVSGRNIAIPGDILFARIEPSIFNKKYVWTDNLHGHEYVFLSTEFYTIRAIDFSLQKFIYAMLFYPAVYEQFFGKTVGSTGRRRLDKRSLEDVIIPMPDIEICKAIGEEFFRRQKMAEELKLSAEKEWQEAKEQFEKELLGE